MFQLEANLFGDGSATFLIWQNLMTFANAGMIVILLAIIFSQLTGFGIDNYGIKKMLPKLIIVAILINLSYLICQVAVDLSNIIGKGIIAAARDAYYSVQSQTGVDGSALTFGAIFASLFGVGAGLGAVAPGLAAAFMAGGMFWLIPIIFLALYALVSVIIFFLMVGLRQLLAALLVAVAPLAMLCYVLPNTQQIYKKWFDAFKIILMVYPICAAILAASRIMRLLAVSSANGDNPGLAIVAIIMIFLPLAAAPKILEKALAIFGEMGGYLQRIGANVKSGLKQAEGLVQNSAVYKDAERTAMLGRAKRNADAYKAVRSGTANRRQRFRAWVSGGERGFARNQALAERGAAEDIEATKMAMREETGNYNVDIMGNQLSGLLNRVDQGETLNAGELRKIDALTSQLSGMMGGAKQIAKASEGRTGASAELMGESMAKNNAVKNAMDSKSRRTSSRLSDIASGAISADTTQEQYDAMNNAYLTHRREEAAAGRKATFANHAEMKQDQANWMQSEQTAGRQVDGTTVVQNIARNVLDKDKDFMTQSTSEIQELVKHVGDARLSGLHNNASAYNLGDIAEGAQLAVRAEYQGRNLPPQGATGGSTGAGGGSTSSSGSSNPSGSNGSTGSTNQNNGGAKRNPWTGGIM